MFGSNTEARTRTTAITGGAVLLIMSAIAMNRPGSDPEPPSEAEVTAECRRLYTELHPTFRAVPEKRFEIRQGDDLLRVYVSATDQWISVCGSGSEGVNQAFATPLTDGPPDQFRLFSNEGSMLKANLVLGRLPAGATTVEARLTSGETVTGTHDGDVFAIWAPDGTVSGAQLTAARTETTVVATTTAP